MIIPPTAVGATSTPPLTNGTAVALMDDDRWRLPGVELAGDGEVTLLALEPAPAFAKDWASVNWRMVSLRVTTSWSPGFHDIHNAAKHTPPPSTMKQGYGGGVLKRHAPQEQR